VAAPVATPRAFSGLIASPNPARTGMGVRFAFAPAERERRLRILDIAGRHVASLAIAPQSREAVWDGHATRGDVAATGIYLARLAGDSNVPATRFLLVR
jgi:hypothetical protein